MIKFDCISLEEEYRINDKYSRMDKEDYFEIMPRIVPAGVKSRITVCCKSKDIRLEGPYLILIVPYYDYDFVSFQTYRDKIIETNATDGKIEFEYSFPTEQMYNIYIGQRNRGDLDYLLQTSVYALDADLYSMKTLTGDFHCHTVHSDGFETPESVLHLAISHKFDFIAVTDHNNYQGSADAAEIAKKQHLPITVIHGEEYSSSFTNMHVISLGASKPLEKTLYTFFPENQNEVRSTFEYTKQLCEEIRNNGGLSVLCHPLRKPFRLDGTRDDVPMSLIKKLLENHVFDAIEIVGGGSADDKMISQMQFLWSIGFGALPGTIAYIGSTDSHAYRIDPLCGKHFTVVFAKENLEKDILKGIKEKRTVAARIIDSNNILLYGEPRFCMYAQFYLKYVSKRIR